MTVYGEKYSFRNSVTKKGATNAAMMTKKSEEQKMTTHGATALRTILVVEDDSLVRETISATLRTEGYTVLAFADGSLPEDIAHDTSLSLILLDATLPSPRIFALCRQLHRSSAMEHIPILMLVAHERERIQIERQGLQVDDYILKPLQKEELHACVRTLLRRRKRSGKQRPTRVFRQVERGGVHEEPLLVGENLRIDRARRTVRQGNHLLDVSSPVLFDLLVYLVLHRGIVLTREQLLRSVWGYDTTSMDASDARTVDVHVHWLRELLNDDAENPYWIQTVRGVGYRFQDEA